MNQDLARTARLIWICASSLLAWGCGGRDISLGANTDGGAAQDGADARSGQLACGLGGQALICDVGAGQVCCITQKTGPAKCQVDPCSADAISIGCDGPEDCAGQICCELRTNPNSSGANVACDATCSGPYQRRVCHAPGGC